MIVVKVEVVLNVSVSGAAVVLAGKALVLSLAVAGAVVALTGTTVVLTLAVAAVVFAGKATDVFGCADVRLVVVGAELLLADVVGAAVLVLDFLCDGGTKGHATPWELQHHFFCSAVHVVSALSNWLQS